MRAVVTGSAGFIGSHLVDRLRADGWDVVEIDSRSLHGPMRMQDVVQPASGFIWSANAIFHLAAPVGPLGVLEWAGRLVPEVIETSRIAARWAIVNGCPLIDVSTSEVYGSGGKDREDGDCTFAASTSARKEYAVAKLAAETMLRNTPGLDVRIVRPFNVAGPRQLPDGGFVLPRFVQQALAGRPLTLYLPGSQRRSLTHVEDVVDGLIAAYRVGIAGEVYNLGNPDNACTIRQLAGEVLAAVGPGLIEMVDPVTIHGPSFREAPDKLPNADKAWHALGWIPKHDRASIIADTVAYWRAELAVAA